MIVRRITPLITEKHAAGGDMTCITPMTPFARPRDVKTSNVHVYPSHEARNPVTGVIQVIVSLKKVLGVIK